ncbi:MAG: spermidine synthase [Betaproteobacteria bacterium]|nr:spermidine synthase [Betaproteobacteria bacterium]
MKFLQSWRIRKPADDNESVYISEKFGVRTLHIGSDTVQSSMRLARPNDLEVAYTRSMMAFLLFKPDPAAVLMVGLGGGSLAKFIYHNLPHSKTVAIEVSQRVVDVARQYFFLPTDDERLNVIVTDGAAYLHDNKPAADVIVVDGYDAESQVEALSTPAFYRDCARALGDAGMMVVNLWGGDRNFTTCVNRLTKAFDGRVACLPAGKPGNIAAFAFKRSPGKPTWRELRARAGELEARYGLEFTRFVEEFPLMNPHDEERLLI